MTDHQIEKRLKKLVRLKGAFGRKYTHPLEGAFDLVGHVIKQAITDYRVFSKKKKLRSDERVAFRDAKYFLFGGALEQLTERYQLALDCDAVRDQVRKEKKKYNRKA